MYPSSFMRARPGEVCSPSKLLSQATYPELLQEAQPYQQAALRLERMGKVSICSGGMQRAVGTLYKVQEVT